MSEISIRNRQWKGSKRMMRWLLFLAFSIGINVLLNIFESLSDVYDPPMLDSFIEYDEGSLTPSGAGAGAGAGAVVANQFIPKYAPQRYADELKTSMEPLVNVTTAAYKPNFWSGFCNQMMMFIGMFFLAQDTNSSQILVESITWKDQFGTNEFIRHDYLFDVVHWNSYYPTLPRIVLHDESIFPDVKIVYRKKRKNRDNDDDIHITPRLQWQVPGDPFINAMRPHPIGQKPTQAITEYKTHINQVHQLGIDRREIELEIVGGALRPHPAIEDMIQEFLFQLYQQQYDRFDRQEGIMMSGTTVSSAQGDRLGSSLPSSSSHHAVPYMVLHARIEPDMQKHFACRDRKVVNMTDIIDQLYEKFKDPPDNISIMIVILARDLLEKEVQDTNIDNELAAHNLHVLNTILKDGLWGGKVRVVEAGSNLAKVQSEKYGGLFIYNKYSTIVGGIINYFLSIDANVFIGTEVSSYSTAVVTSRFFRGGKRSVGRSRGTGTGTGTDTHHSSDKTDNMNDNRDIDRRRRENYFYAPEGLNWVTPDDATQPPKFQC